MLASVCTPLEFHGHLVLIGLTTIAVKKESTLSECSWGIRILEGRKHESLDRRCKIPHFCQDSHDFCEISRIPLFRAITIYLVAFSCPCFLAAGRLGDDVGVRRYPNA